MKEEKKTEVWKEAFKVLATRFHQDDENFQTLIVFIASEKEASYKDGKKEGVNEVLEKVEKDFEEHPVTFGARAMLRRILKKYKI